ncbi:SH3 domain-containing protein [Starkeya sp. ORNL1]|uniref:SH3 domain-containing protein n=1 Tax=Starkeya sp. ORNL1 TaxID=2709380 RepID=UPI0014646F9F|nr:SH3 domain-containing protein [Starkeya sp. ORNL1]QJP13627.1 SH3 domain-containing protein [Starkeya sp. ORNL1]
MPLACLVPPARIFPPALRRALALVGALAALALSGTQPLRAADEVSRVEVKFAAGASSASYQGSVRGNNSVEYRLGARAGQTMTVTFRARNPSANFNVNAPGSDMALFVGSVSGSDFTGALPADGIYVVQVYLVRAAARRNESADYTIDFSIGSGSGRAPQPGAPQVAAMPPLPKTDFADGFAGGPDFWQVAGLVPGDTLNIRSGPSATDAVLVTLNEGAVVRNMGCRPVAGARWCKVQLQGDANTVGWASGRYLREAAGEAAPKANAKASDAKASADAKVAGTQFNATGEVDCRLPGDKAVRACRFGVTRAGQGRASVEISFPDGSRRTLRFSHGLVTTSDGSAVVSARESDNTVVTVNGTERFVVPDVVVDGD